MAVKTTVINVSEILQRVSEQRQQREGFLLHELAKARGVIYVLLFFIAILAGLLAITPYLFQKGF